MASQFPRWQDLSAIAVIISLSIGAHHTVVIQPMQEDIKEQEQTDKDTFLAINALQLKIQEQYHGLDVSNAELTVQLKNQAQATEKLALAVDRLYQKMEKGGIQ